MDSKKLITSIIGIATAIIAVIGTFNIISNDQSAELIKWVPVLVNGIASLVALFGSDGNMKIKNLF